jgi:hypothetical protein
MGTGDDPQRHLLSFFIRLNPRLPRRSQTKAGGSKSCDKKSKNFLDTFACI